MSLDDLAAQVAWDLEALAHGGASWTRPRAPVDGEPVHDVVIVGGGQSGLGAAFGLMRERVSNILVIDENPAGYEGPWDTYARMVTLRTPKAITSIDLGIPSLTFRAYWEAQHGPAGWEAVGKIPRRDWMAYLRWYRQVLGIPVRNETRLDRIEPQAGGVHVLQVSGPGAPASGRIVARKVVLATGIQGGGEWHTPGFIRDALPKSRYAHTSEPIDYEALKGKRVAILGGGASAFDNAQHALSLGVAAAEVFIRRREMPRVNPIRHMEQAGLIGRYTALDDAGKYAVMVSFLDRNQPPTNDTFDRAAAYPGFALHLGAPWESVEETAEGVVVTTPQGRFTYDFLVLSTGLVSDPALRPELALVADDIARWSDRYVPDGRGNALADAHPYLGQGFQFTARSEAGVARLHGLFAFNYSALISLGLSAAALSGLKQAIPKLVTGVANQLFLDDEQAMLQDYLDYSEIEFTGQWVRPEAGA
ncbi:NAD(P)/FAD-dependent oxidoreductase [Sphingomonas naphthae]|uniref:NAD(P)/FAD-dependent oxidoreductase n=1 Tax=Sphingomonas naphthae TaxID=1813468 RepID=A0ABY7TL13_9SPHN|nr:NAD(P)/FAD-dependent oxidoreductase [Sphingomonas naphthae]WCT73723.1 NAD(P)/FAD-dependent oxidoreductase [Sphingomonas naphthae]